MNKKEDIYKDERFAHLLKNPRFKTIPKKESKIKIDDRFKAMFEDEKFNIQYNVDKYGRKINKKSSDNLKDYYHLESSDSSEDDEEEAQQQEDAEAIPGNAVIKGGNKMPKTLKDKLKDMEVDYIRGEGILKSDSSDEESSEDDEDVDVEHNWGELDRDAERTDDSSRRIACMHMDWDRIRAVDIMVLCNSFIPAGSGSVLSVKIYPSEFGKERMAEEELKGPKEITEKSLKDAEENPVDEENEEYVEKLREYQLKRLKYFYAVVEFDSIKTADVVYKECDGLEYESTSNRLDLRFIPDDMEFDDEPKDTCTELPDFSKYEPRIFFTSALQHAKVELTWDETDVSRKELAEKLFSDKSKEINDRDLRNYVAFSSESENESESEANESESEVPANEKSKINLYKSLLDEINQKEEEKKKRQIEMEYSWGVGGSSSKKLSDDEEEKEELTPFEKILDKKKQKKKLKKEIRAKKLQGGEEEEDENGYSSDDFDDIDMNDPFFAEEFANDEFKKPTKKSKKMAEKSKNDSDEDEEKNQSKKALELLLQDDTDDRAHFSLKKIQEAEDTGSKKKKRKLKKMKRKGVNVEEPEDNFQINLHDERFKAIFTQPEFNIDPTNSGFKKTKGMEKFIEEKLKRRYETDDKIQPASEPVEKKQNIKDVSLNMLVKNIKRKVGKQ